MSNKLIARILLLMFLGLIAPSTRAENIIKASYVLKWGNITIGEVKRQLDIKNGVYNFVSNAKPEGLAKLLTRGINEHSVFKVKDDKIIPMRYFYQQRGRKPKQVIHKYNWGTKTLQIVKPHELKVRNISPHTVDILNSQYLVMLGLKNGKKIFNVAMYEDEARPKIYSLKVHGEWEVSVPLGDYYTVLVARSDNSRSKFNLWCAPELGYLPVKIAFTNIKGHEFTMTLKSLG